MKRHRSLLAVVCAVLAAPLTLTAAAHAQTGAYVALGDSYTSAPLVLNQVGQPIGCARSDHNYPSLVAAATGAADVRDVSCSSATTEHMTAPQSTPLGVNPPQFGALHAGATLVTVGIGGNDVGLVGAAVKCVELGLLAPTGTACRSSFAKPGGGDRIVDQIAASAPKIAATLQGIRARSPQARVLIVGYPDVAPLNGGSCYPLVPLSADDIAYLDEMLRRTNAMIAEQAAANDAEYVDTYEDSIGHDVCTPPGTRWFEGLVPTAPAFPIHPNALGEASMARSVLRVLGRPRPGPSITSLTRAQDDRRRPRAAGELHAEPRRDRDVRPAALARPRALLEAAPRRDGRGQGRDQHADALVEAARPASRALSPDRAPHGRHVAAHPVPHPAGLVHPAG